MNKKQGGEIMEQTAKIKLLPIKEQEKHLNHISKEYIKSVNKLVDEMVQAKKLLKLSSKDVSVLMPSAVKNQAIRDAKSIYRRSKQLKRVPILKKPVCIWNNQNYKIKENIIEFPVCIKGKSKRIAVKAVITEYQYNLLKNKLGTLRITKKSTKWIAQICVTVEEPNQNESDIVMGVDLGLKVPAVAVTSTKKTKFFGNGRQNKYIRRKFKSKHRELGKSKKLNAICKLNDKEQRWMKNQDHKISRKVVDFAIDNNVSVIRLEKLSNIRNTARTSRKNEKNLHTWSFYRLAIYIEYKAKLVGIKVEYVNPKYTSQTCPVCGKQNHAKDRKYQCSCGFKTHRDRVAGMNIIHAPVVDGAA
jgi:putative transposase